MGRECRELEWVVAELGSLVPCCGCEGLMGEAGAEISNLKFEI
jgi:hypothetical protein